MIDVLLAVPEHPQEQELVSGAFGAGLHVVRRCVDGVELLAAAASDPEVRVVVSAGLPRLSSDIVDRLARTCRRPIIGLATGAPDADRLDRLGVARSASTGPTALATLRQLAEALATDGGAIEAGGVWPTGCWAGDPDAATASEGGAMQPSEPGDRLGRLGRLVVVWGAMGAPGRTTVAIGLAEAMSESGMRTCLVDADTYAPSVAMSLGLVEPGGGLLAACRHADNGSLTPGILMSCARQVRGAWSVLAGLPAPDQWPDLRAAALERVWGACRAAADVTVVDAGFCLEDDESPAAWSRRRNAASLAAVAGADHVVAVADATAAGAARLVAAWPALQARGGGTPVTVVRNRSRGRDRAWQDAVRACGISAPVHAVPADERALAACWGRGRSLGEGARRSRIRSALGELAASVVSG